MYIPEDEEWFEEFKRCEHDLDMLIDAMLRRDKLTESENKMIEERKYIESHEMIRNEEFAMNDISDKIRLLKGEIYER